MTRGTTPKHTFYFGYELPEINALFVTYAQDGETVIEKNLADVEIAGDRKSLSLSLTQEETLAFNEGTQVEVQIRFKDSEGSAYSTVPAQLTAGRILKEGEI